MVGGATMGGGVAAALSASSCGCGAAEADASGAGAGAAEDCSFFSKLLRLRLRRRRPPDRLLLVVVPAAAAFVLGAWTASFFAAGADNGNRCSGQLQGGC